MGKVNILTGFGALAIIACSGTTAFAVGTAAGLLIVDVRVSAGGNQPLPVESARIVNSRSTID